VVPEKDGGCNVVGMATWLWFVPLFWVRRRP
jgi:hypothetical protein